MPLTLGQQIASLSERIWALECSDDALFCNANGNLALWQSMVDELKQLREALKQ